MRTKMTGAGLAGLAVLGVAGLVLRAREEERLLPRPRSPALEDAARRVLRDPARRSVAVVRDTVPGRLPVPRLPALRPGPNGEAVGAARALNRAAGTLAFSVLADSAVEHYRGGFRNPAMITPLVTSAASLLVSAHGQADTRREAHLARDTVYAAAGASGVIGTGFHLYNIVKQPGGFSWQNLFYKAPLGAPMAIALSGLLGFLAERVRDTPRGGAPEILGIPAGRAVAAVTGAGLLGTVGEAGLLHFRGAFQNPAMLLPVTMPPVAAALIGNAALQGTRGSRPMTRWWLRLTALLGIGGVAFHAYGVQRMMGGWRNWTQNLQDGPPLPAPPSFTGLALAGLAALKLLGDRGDE